MQDGEGDETLRCVQLGDGGGKLGGQLGGQLGVRGAGQSAIEGREGRAVGKG